MNAVTPAAIEARLAALGLRLPVPPRPVGRYQALIVRNGIGYVSGQFPFEDGELRSRGRLGRELDTARARAAARVAALNVLAQIATSERGFNSFGGLLRVDGFIASMAEKQLQQPHRVLDAASEVFVDVLGPTLGAHTRTLLCVPRLPLDAPVELGVTFAAIS